MRLLPPWILGPPSECYTRDDVAYLCLLLSHDVTCVMGDGHGHLVQRHVRDIVFCVIFL